MGIMMHAEFSENLKNIESLTKFLYLENNVKENGLYSYIIPRFNTNGMIS